MKKMVSMLSMLALATACNSLQVVPVVHPVQVLEIQFDEGGEAASTQSSDLSLKPLGLQSFTVQRDGLHYATATYEVTNLSSKTFHNLGFLALNLDDLDADPSNQPYPITLDRTPFTQVKNQQGEDATAALRGVLLRRERTLDQGRDVTVVKADSTRFVDLLEPPKPSTSPPQGMQMDLKSEGWVLDGDLAPGQTRQIQFTLSYPISEQGPLDLSLLVTPVDKMPDPMWHTYPELYPRENRPWIEAILVQMTAQDHPVVAASEVGLSGQGSDVVVKRWTGTSWDRLPTLIHTDAGQRPWTLLQLELDPQGLPHVLAQQVSNTQPPVRQLQHLTWNGITWETQTYSDTASNGKFPQVKLHTDGKLYAWKDNMLQVAEGPSWVPVTGAYGGLSSQAVPFEVLDFTLDHQGTPLLVVSFLPIPDPDPMYELRVARWDGTSWVHTPVLGDGSTLFNPLDGANIYTTADNRPVVTWRHHLHNFQALLQGGAFWTGSGWTTYRDMHASDHCQTLWGTAEIPSNRPLMQLRRTCGDTYEVVVANPAKLVTFQVPFFQGRDQDTFAMDLVLDRNDQPVVAFSQWNTVCCGPEPINVNEVKVFRWQ